MGHSGSLGLATEVSIPSGLVSLGGELRVPAGARGIVLFAHGSGSSRFSPRNQQVAGAIRGAGIGTLLFDLLTAQEEAAERVTRHLRFNIDLLAGRLRDATVWLQSLREAQDLTVGYFGASTGAAAALVAAAELGDTIKAVVSRGGRPDLAGNRLPFVKAPTLLIVGGADEGVIDLNRQAFARLNCVKEMTIVPGATHLFEERGALEKVALLATNWFAKYFTGEPVFESA
ncbi:MAG TPA: dienelactone hydrolase family protein [Blastocatellia bacterium]|nr:dienelactone hydrolase family protein [Blastocatellia bacterium]